MNTIEDFKNAPDGATATRKATGIRALKIADDCWFLSSERYADDEDMARRDYTLDPSAPTTAREALDLAWDFAHEVKEGQVIPEGTRYLTFFTSGMREYTARYDFKPDLGHASNFRTLEPLTEPEPDWLDALVVLARHVKQAPDSPPSLWANLGGGLWGLVEATKRATVRELRDVTPLYPKGQDA